MVATKIKPEERKEIPVKPNELNNTYPRNGAVVPRTPVRAAWTPMYSASLPFGANLVTHKFQAKLAPPIAIPPNTVPMPTPSRLEELK